MKKSLFIVAVLLTLLGWFHQGYAQTPLRIARIENIPDQFVGGEILKVTYSRLNIRPDAADDPCRTC
jgi:polar amino acid transport system substrate-binding protein